MYSESHYYPEGYSYVPFYAGDSTGKAKWLRLAEPLIQTIDGQNIVTVNNFNGHVINSTNLWITDIDLNQGDPSSQYPTLSAALHAIRGVAMSEGLGCRVYETRGGLRVIEGSTPMACNARAIELMKKMLSDAKYVALCAATKTYRARVSAKPMGPVPPPRQCAVTRYLETIGSTTIHRKLKAVIAFHDAATKALSGLRILV